MEVKIVREPKGGPDVIFIGGADSEKRLLRAGDYLSVRGFTARIVTLPEGIAALASLPPEAREKALAGGAPYISVCENGNLAVADAATLANAALEALRS